MSETYEPGELFVYTNGDHWELGEVKSSSEIDRYVSLYRKRILEKKSPKTLYNKILKEEAE